MIARLPRRSHLRWRMVALLAFLAAATPGSADTPLRDRLQERIAPRGSDPGDAPSASSLGPGTHTLHLKHEGSRRKYLVHVPPGYRPSTPVPLVLAFHGGGGHAEFMADDTRYGLARKADLEGFVVVFPNGYSKLPRGRLATWNAGACCGDARDRQVDDVGFALAVVAAVKAQVRIDPARVFATGMSNGGMLGHRLACEASHVFRAVAAVAGTDATLSCQPSRAASVLHIHARNDTHVLFDGGAGKDAFRDASKVTDFVSVPETMRRWVQRHQCDPTPRRVLERAGAYCEAYTGCKEEATVQLCVTEDGGHSWPGANAVRPGKEPASRHLDANDVLWDFFRASAASPPTSPPPSPRPGGSAPSRPAR